MTFLTINNLSAHIGKRKILRDASLSVQAGEVCGLVGESGAGKSSLLAAVVENSEKECPMLLTSNFMTSCR